MKQCNTFEDLQALGTEKLHERTHISRDKVDLVLAKSYGEIGRVQFMGYISIFEREYGIDLAEIKEEYTEFYRNNANVLTPKQSVILQSTSNSKPKWIAAGIILIFILMAGGYFLQGKMSTEPHEEVMELTTLAVEVMDDHNDMNASESNETNITTSIVSPVVNLEANKSVPNVSKTLISGQEIAIYPTYKVWYGMIDMASGEKMQNITGEPIIIDTTKDWLIVLGHGRVEIGSPEDKKVFNEKNSIHFICEKGIIKQINEKEFIQRNGGKNW